MHDVSACAIPKLIAVRGRDGAVAAKVGVKHRTAITYMFVPAVRQACELMMHRTLRILYRFRAFCLHEWIMPHYHTSLIWRTDKRRCGSGALDELGCQVLDLGRFRMAEMKSVGGMTRTFVSERPLPECKGTVKVDVDNAFDAVQEFGNGGIETLEAFRFAAGHKNHGFFKIKGETDSSIGLTLERLNELKVFCVGEEPKETQGFHEMNITEEHHPFISNWWPQGHRNGWKSTFAHQFDYVLNYFVNNKDVALLAASFVDGCRKNVMCDAIVESAARRRQIDVAFQMRGAALDFSQRGRASACGEWSRYEEIPFSSRF